MDLNLLGRPTGSWATETAFRPRFQATRLWQADAGVTCALRVQAEQSGGGSGGESGHVLRCDSNRLVSRQAPGVSSNNSGHSSGLG